MEGTIHEIYECLNSPAIPAANPDCDYYTYREAVREAVIGQTTEVRGQMSANSRVIFYPIFRTLLHCINYLVWFNHRPKECSRVALLLIRYAREAGFVREVRCRCEDETGWHVVPVTEIGTQHKV